MTTVSLSVSIQRKRLLPWQRPDTVFKTSMAEAPVAGVYEPGGEYSRESLRIRDRNWSVALGQDTREVIDLSAHLHGLSRTRDQSAAEEAARSAADKFLVIAGTVWKKIGEPYYEIIDSGQDGERGTTTLAHRNANYPVEDTAYCYRADEREQAVKDAADLAARRGPALSRPCLFPAEQFPQPSAGGPRAGRRFAGARAAAATVRLRYPAHHLVNMIAAPGPRGLAAFAARYCSAHSAVPWLEFLSDIASLQHRGIYPLGYAKERPLSLPVYPPRYYGRSRTDTPGGV